MVVAPEGNQRAQSQTIGEENLSGCIQPDLERDQGDGKKNNKGIERRYYDVIT